MTDVAAVIRDIDNGCRLSADGLASLVCRSLYDQGLIRLDQVRPIGAFIAANASMDPEDLAAAIVTDFHLTQGEGR